MLLEASGGWTDWQVDILMIYLFLVTKSVKFIIMFGSVSVNNVQQPQRLNDLHSTKCAMQMWRF